MFKFVLPVGMFLALLAVSPSAVKAGPAQLGVTWNGGYDSPQGSVATGSLIQFYPKGADHGDWDGYVISNLLVTEGRGKSTWNWVHYKMVKDGKIVRTDYYYVVEASVVGTSMAIKYKAYSHDRFQHVFSGTGLFFDAAAD